MHPELLITNIGFIISTVLTLAVGLFVVIKGRNAKLKWLFFAFTVSVSIFLTSHVVGVNIEDVELSRKIFLLNMNNIIFIALNVHWILVALKKDQELKWHIGVIYAGAVALLATYIIFPDKFMMTSVTDVLYFKSYYNPGSLYPLMSVYLYGIFAYYIYILMKIYKASEQREKNRLIYFVAAMIFGYILGSFPALPLYGINFDPIASVLMGLWTLPMAYGIVTQDLMDIKIVTKKAVVYASLVTIVNLLINAVSYSNNYMTRSFDGFPIWVIPLTASIVSAGFVTLVGRRIRDIDNLKYEFINVATHKFRTPLTHMKLATESIRESGNFDNKEEEILKIKSSGARLTELTDIVVGLARFDEEKYSYKYEGKNLGELTREIVDGFKSLALEKNIKLTFSVAQEIPNTLLDISRIQFAIQNLIENSINYTQVGGAVDVSVSVKEKDIEIIVRDNGIGISKEDLQHIFSKFYRTNVARSMDTEGIGVALYMTKNIIHRHQGSIVAYSPGEGKGSIFQIKIPIRSK